MSTRPNLIIKTFIITLFVLPMGCQNQSSENNLISEILLEKNTIIDEVMLNPNDYKLQILYTQIDRDSLNLPHFASYEFNVSEEYFYPASTVKMPTAFMALEKVNNLNIEMLDNNSKMLTDSAFSGQVIVHEDTTSQTGFPSLGHYIKKIFLVSDNNAYNRLYEFIGQQELNEGLKAKGFGDTRITHRLEIFLNKEENQTTNPIRFYNEESLVYDQPQQKSEIDFTSSDPILLGKGHYRNGELIEEPMDFAAKNYMSLNDMQTMLQRVLFPEIYSEQERFGLTEDDYRFIYKYMSMLPGESRYPDYGSTYYDSYVKFFIFGDRMDPIPDNIRIFNKVGDAYGFLIDNAYIVDFKNNVEFLLSAVIQVNENEIYNDGKYEYDKIGFPFMAEIGKLFYEYELERPKKHSADLSKFKLDYSDQN